MILIRPVVSALVAACFALSAVTWGSMPGCTLPAQVTAAPSGPGHESSHNHSSPGQVPGTPQCLIHLCCIQLATSSPKAKVSERFSEPDRTSGFLAKKRALEARPSHTLPFAHAPPQSAA
jgi:hypothetical protein